MSEIVPAIIAENREELERKFWAVRGVAKRVQVDVSDGVFVTSKSWPYNGGSPSDLLQYAGNVEIEVHLMIDAPEKTLRDWVSCGAKRIIVHYEATKELGAIAEVVRNAGLELGIALKLETPISAIDPWVEYVSVIQLMGIAEIGYYGHSFEDSAVEKLQAARMKYPSVMVEVDGGINSENAARLAEIGAERLVVGSGIFKAADPKKAFEELSQLVQNK